MPSVLSQSLGDVLEHAPGAQDLTPPVLVCLLGTFRLLRNGQPLAVRRGGRMEALLTHLGLGAVQGVPREALLGRVWPDSEPTLAGHALNTLVHRIGDLLGGALDGAPPIVRAAGLYRLNREAGVHVDVAHFKALTARGDELERRGQSTPAAELYARAVRLYAGDLGGAGDGRATVMLERELLRTTYLGLLMRLADYAFEHGDFGQCVAYATELLARDPCREDAHRMVMRCHVRRGERAQALRHYATVQAILRAEFDVAPEPATDALFEQIRRQPGSV
jgi:DNA-binding SARP family transcriptional activator